MRKRSGPRNICWDRVIYGDTDKMGVVYYANYLRWFEKGRSEFLRQIGIPYTEIENRGLHFPVIEVFCRYHRPAAYDDKIMVETYAIEIGRATLTFQYAIYKDGDPALIAEGTTRHACVTPSRAIARIPTDLAERLGADPKMTRD